MDDLETFYCVYPKKVHLSSKFVLNVAKAAFTKEQDQNGRCVSGGPGRRGGQGTSCVRSTQQHGDDNGLLFPFQSTFV